MKYLLLFLFSIGNYLLLNSQIKVENSCFKQISSLDEIEHADNKKILIYATSKFCGACVRMENTTFNNDTTINYLSQNFNSYKICMDSFKNEELKSLLKINCYPSFCILDSDFRLIHKFTGYSNTIDFIQNCSVYNTENSLSINIQKFVNGDRDKNFLYDLCVKLKNANELDSFYVNQYLDHLTFEELGSDKNLSFILNNSVINFNSMISLESRTFNFILQNKNKYSEKFGKETIDNWIIWIVYDNALKEIQSNNYVKFKNAIDELKNFDNTYSLCFLKNEKDEILGFISGENMIHYLYYLFYEKNGNSKQKKEYLKIYLNIISNNADQLNNFASGIYYEYNETSKIKIAKKCIKRSIKLEKSSSNEKMYAFILYKLGEKNKALRHAKIALKLSEDKDEIADFINQIEK